MMPVTERCLHQGSGITRPRLLDQSLHRQQRSLLQPRRQPVAGRHSRCGRVCRAEQGPGGEADKEQPSAVQSMDGTYGLVPPP